ncbi:MAG: radical SAM family heme chaperone HemW [Saprospiraceae bacterium]|nr:radical SAM family heme chaperone HemW [Saprospiraceae bacterium]
MAGIYIHIPFCKKACVYCNFHFSTSLRLKNEMMEAIHKELQLRKAYLGENTVIETIYLGGGTPSLLSADEVNTLFDTINQYYNLASEMEVTLEANPDDLELDKIQAYRNTPINRFSIGIQSFFEEDLRFMGRAHSADQAKACLENALNSGFEQLTIDLIYGTPTLSHTHWEENLRIATGLKIPHLSCYALTVEPKTALEYQIDKGKKADVDEEDTAQQFETLLAITAEEGYEQYEISNFCRPPHYAQHNSNYWKQVPYLGIGPSAHSFDGKSRQWNIAHNPKYIEGIQKGKLESELEVLTPQDLYNEYLLTGLRTKWGVDKRRLSKLGSATQQKQFAKAIAPQLASGHASENASSYFLTPKGRLLADRLISDLFWVD